MSYLYLVMSGILFGGVVFGAKVLYLMGASLFEVLFYPNLISVLLVWGFARRDFVKIFKMPWRITAVYVLSVTAIAFGQAAPLFLDVPVTLVVLLIYLQPVWTILIVRFWFKRRQNAKSWFLVGSMIVGLLLLINPFGGLSFSLPGITLALLAGVGLSVWLVVTKYYTRQGISPAGTLWAESLYSLLPVVGFFLWGGLWGTDNTGFELRFCMAEKLWVAFVFYGAFVYVLPNLFLFAGNKDVSTAAIGMIMLLEPVTGICLDVAFLHVGLTWNIIAGGLIIIAANAVLITGQIRKRKKALPK